MGDEKHEATVIPIGAWRAECSCGWTGTPRAFMTEAGTDLNAHLAAEGPPTNYKEEPDG